MPELGKLAALKIDPSERAVNRPRTGVWLLVLVALLAGGGWYWSAHQGAAVVRAAAVTIASGPAADASGVVLNGSGYVTARRRATVSSKITGKVIEVFVEEGHAVREGQVLARLDPTQPNAALAYAEAQLAAARKATAEDAARLHEAEVTLGRQRQLFGDGIIGRAEVDAAEANVEAIRARIAFTTEQMAVADAQVQQRRADVTDTVVRAPFSGIAVSKDAQPGEMISPVSAGGGFTRTGICTIVDMASLEIEVDVNEGYINRVRDGQPVEAILDAYPDWRIPSHVIAVVPTADRQKATVKVRIGFDKLDPRILPDMGVKVSFLSEATVGPVRTAAPHVVMPKSAARIDAGRTIVFVIRGGQVERRAVTLGTEDAGQVEVLSGLTDGDRVVTDGPATLKDGDRITEA
ncbi:MAG: macA 1 [Acidobacteria bacterium]|nr:macA 1 [Acidobacteriota bacterium]